MRYYDGEPSLNKIDCRTFQLLNLRTQFLETKEWFPVNENIQTVRKEGMQDPRWDETRFSKEFHESFKKSYKPRSFLMRLEGRWKIGGVDALEQVMRWKDAGLIAATEQDLRMRKWKRLGLVR